MKMRSVFLLLLVAFAAMAETHDGNHRRREKRELLVRAKRRWVLSTIEVSEEDPGPFPKEISQMFNDKINLQNRNHKFQISGMGVTEDPIGVFRINDQNGMVEALRSIDREQYSLFHIKFDILDRDTGQRIDRELAFDIEIKDINDNPPRFLKPQMTADVKENMPEGYLPVQMQVIDLDQQNTSNSKVKVSLVSQTPNEPKIDLIQLDARMAQLTFKGCFNYDKVKKYKIILMAQDHGKPALSSSATVNLNILDTNSHAPMFVKKEYYGEVQESTTKNELLRIAVEDNDTPNTPAWRAKYYFIKGNEENNYKIETDNKTNEGILSVIKGKNFERTTLTTIQIGVENEEPLYVCNGNSPATGTFKDSINVTVKVVDVNDPPEFEKEKVDVYRREEDAPGKELFTPKVKDVDSDLSKMRYVLLKDPANWVSLDKKTGKVTTVKKMDRESPYVNNSVYPILVGAIDDGEPPATGTCTVLVHLGDINDNVPHLVNTSLLMCGNKVNKVTVRGKDADVAPFSGPFAFSFGGEDKSVRELWKLEPTFGEEVSLIRVKEIPYGNYSVPLVIQDQQNMNGYDTLRLTVCDCGEGHVCRRTVRPRSLALGLPAIGLIIAGLLILLLLLAVLIEYPCEVKPITPEFEKGCQNLITYNQEGGGAACMTEPLQLPSPTFSNDVMDFRDSYQMMPTTTSKEVEMYGSQFTTANYNMSSLGQQHRRDTVRSQWGPNMQSTWASGRTHTFKSGSRYHRSSIRQNHDVEDQVARKVSKIDESIPEYHPCQYAYEGGGSKCESLENVVTDYSEDNLQFLDNLGPKFNFLGGICQDELMKKKAQC